MNAKIRPVKDILWFIALLGLMSGVFRMWFGLGATTNMVDGIPWGLWKILNMVAGAALATSGFMIGVFYYVFKMKQFKPLVAPSVVIAFLGYGSSLFSLLFDIGLPWRFWIPFFSWSPHSFLYEVFWCVSIYWGVTAFELTPSILDRLKSEKAAKVLHSMGFATAVIGVSLSSLHHSSLGSLFLVTPQRLYPLWYSPYLPLFFIISAMGAGLMFLLLMKILYAYFYDPESVFGLKPKEGAITCAIDGAPVRNLAPGKDMPMLRKLAVIAVSILGVYLVLKVGDLFRSGSWQKLTSGDWESGVYIFELLCATVIPIILVAIPKSRRSPSGLFTASLFAVFGLVLNRLDVGIIGYFRDAGTVYLPSLAEWLLSFGIVSATLLVFMFLAENVTVFDESWKKNRVARGLFRGSFDNLSHVWQTVLSDSVQRVTLIAVVAVPFAWFIQYPPFHDANAGKSNIQPAIGLDALRSNLRIDGDRAGVYADFPHAEHQAILGGKNSCQTCHHLSMPGDKSTSCSRCHRDMLHPTNIFDHTYHVDAIVDSLHLTGFHPGNFTCDACHKKDYARTADNAKSCLECHVNDMGVARDVDPKLDLKFADSYQQAMHGKCITCHEEKAQASNHSELNKCYICHESLQPQAKAIEAVADANLRVND